VGGGSKDEWSISVRDDVSSEALLNYHSGGEHYDAAEPPPPRRHHR